MAGKRERQRKLARERYRRRALRQAERARQVRRWTAIGIICCVIVALAVGGYFVFHGSSQPAAAAKRATTTSSATPPASATPSATAVAEPATHCSYSPSPPAARTVGLPPATPDFKASFQATIRTNRGNVVIDLLNSKATCTVNSFVYLASKKYFNVTPCPRLATSGGLYVLQCGDPTGTGSGGPGYVFASENLTGATYPAGTLAMAHAAAPVSNGSQFFIVYQKSSLPPSYTPFGTIVKGLNIIQNVGSAGFGPPLNPAGGGKPKKSVVIESVTIKKA